ncbi:MAG: hypothetical protein M1835_007046 [Candelina submexicana]|nr:MAG: hypothetical protein M1835_007046 [Candelina submexicana]
MSLVPAGNGNGNGQPVLRIDQRVFANIDELINFIKEADPQDRYAIQLACGEMIIKLMSTWGENVEKFWDYVLQDASWQREGVDRRDFMEKFAVIERAATNAKKDRNRALEAARKIRDALGPDSEHLLMINSSYNFLSAIRKCSNTMSYREMMKKANNVMVRRLTEGRQGVSNAKVYQTSDFDRARDENASMADIPNDILARLELRVNSRRLLVPNPVGNLQQGTSRLSIAQGTFPMPGTGNIGRPTITDTGTVELGRRMTTRSMAQAQGFVSEIPQLPQTPRQPQQQRILGSGASGDVLMSSGGSLPFRPSGDQQTPAANRMQSQTPGSPESPLVARGIGSRPVDTCKCGPQVTEAWKREVHSKGKFDTVKNIRLVKEFLEFGTVCWMHGRDLAAHCGFQIKQLNTERMRERLQIFYENRGSLGTLKTANETYSWFRVSDRPRVPADQLGPYRLIHAKPEPYHFNQARLREQLHNGAAVVREWDKDGSVIITGVFRWFWDYHLEFPGIKETCVADVMDQELKMYKYHLREINGRPNYGWMRNCFYSIAQQIVRQDPEYYMWYCALREDKATTLVSYPYYMKYAEKGDNTYFRHMDINIPRLLAEGRGKNLIQGSVSLDDEDMSNCTEILPGMNKHMADWWPRVVARGAHKDGFVHNFGPGVYTAEDIKHFGIDWTPVPCHQGDIRITKPDIPHGARGPSTGIRRTMLPWFIAVQPDHEQLETLEAGTWSELSAAHRDLVAARTSPSGLANLYGVIPYRFPAAVEIRGLSALSDALIGARRWDSLEVMQERAFVLGSNREAARKFIKDWRRKALIAAVNNFRLVKKAEMAAFGTKSYFYRRDNNLTTNVDDDSPTQMDREEDDGQVLVEPHDFNFTETGSG